MSKFVTKKRTSLKTLLEDNPVQKCVIITMIAVIYITVGFFLKNPVVMILGLLPAALYEAYRAWGVSTKIASILLFLILVFELILLLFNINFDLSKFFNISKKYISGYGEIFIDIKTTLPLIIIFLSTVLLVRTVGLYTKWLFLILIIGCFFVIYILYPSQFNKLLNYAVKIFYKLSYF